MVGCCPVGVTEPGKLINQFVHAEYAVRPSKKNRLKRLGKLVSIDDEVYRLRFINVAPSATLSFNRETVLESLQQHVSELYPMVGVMLVYNPLINYSIEITYEIVPQLMTATPSLGPIPMILVADRCREIGSIAVPYSDVKEWVNERDIPVVEVRGEEGTNVELAFVTLAVKVLQNVENIDEE